jgi:hypothetical protein
MKRRERRLEALLGAAVLIVCIAGCTQGEPIEGRLSGQQETAPAASAAPVEPQRDDGVQDADEKRLGFDQDEVGTVPRGFSAIHSGDGSPGRWQVVAAEDAPSGRQAVAQIDVDRTSYRFPLLVLDSPTVRDVALSVEGKPISGKVDQAIGLIWRYRDADNYYVVRANALEDNVVLYKMEAGRRSDLDLKGKGSTYGVDAEVPQDAWSRLGVRAKGNLFTVLLDGEELFQVEDGTFTEAGKVGLWTKADSVTWFDDLEVVVLDGERP